MEQARKSRNLYQTLLETYIDNSYESEVDREKEGLERVKGPFA